MTKSPHTDCTAHSGLNVKVNILLALSSIATILLTALIPIASGIQAGVAQNSGLIAGNARDIARIEGRIEAQETRLQKLERKM